MFSGVWPNWKRGLVNHALVFLALILLQDIMLKRGDLTSLVTSAFCECPVGGGSRQSGRPPHTGAGGWECDL